MPRVLVTGGAGYIGSHACKALARAGHEPIVYDSMEAGFHGFVKWGPLEIGDVRDASRLSAVLRQYEPDAVMHFAAYIAAGESVTNPQKYHDNNVVGSRTLLDAMRGTGVSTLVFSSTASVYGNPQTTPIREDHPCNPTSPYAETKLIVERMLADAGAQDALRWAALRYFNAAGADPEGELGECHDPETHLIPLAIRAALGLSEPLRIFGDDYKTPDGTAIRDYIHVSDLATAHVAALEYLLGGGDSAAMNLGVGVGHSVNDVIATVERVLGKPVPRSIAGRRPGDPRESVADARLAAERLAWRPQLTDLETIVRTAAAWEGRRVAEIAALNGTKSGETENRRNGFRFLDSEKPPRPDTARRRRGQDLPSGETPPRTNPSRADLP